MTPTQPRPATESLPSLGEVNEQAGHMGSASTRLTGRAVVLAWLASIGFHGLILLVTLAWVFPFGADEEDPPVRIALAEVIGTIDSASLAPIPKPQSQDQMEITDIVAPRVTPKQFAPLTELTTHKKPDLSIIGIGAGGGDFDDFGLSVGGMPGPEFFGVGGSARGAKKVVYVVDRSGSMVDTFIYVQKELRRSILNLRRSQKFHVIFFSSGKPVENPPRRLVSAIAARKEAFFEFMGQVTPAGGTHPEEAMRQAIALEPDLIYLLSDGDEFPPALLRKLKEWNARARVPIYTIAYLSHMGRNVLERIAREHKGEFTFVSEHDLP